MTVDPRVEAAAKALAKQHASFRWELHISEAEVALAAADAVEGDRRYEEFIKGLTAKLQEAGVPAMPSWPEAIDWLVSRARQWNDWSLPPGGVEPSREAGDSTPCDPHGSMLCCGGTDYHDAGCPVPELQARVVELTAALRELNRSFAAWDLDPSSYWKRDEVRDAMLKADGLLGAAGQGEAQQP